MGTRKTWVWIAVGLLSLVLVALLTVAGVGVYFVTRHIQTERISSADAIRAFESVAAGFGDPRPLYEMDGNDHAKLRRPWHTIPSSPRRPDHMQMLAWNPDEQRLVRVSLPFWMLRFSKRRLQGVGDDRLDFEDLDLDPRELERIGPILVLDFRNAEGARVLVWTR